MLNAQTDPKELMDFLHSTISDNVEIYMAVHDPDHSNAGTLNVKLSKADYINSYLYGPRQVENYEAVINTDIIDVDTATQTLTSKETIVETGVMKNPRDLEKPGRDFTSRTTCESVYALDSNNLPILKASHCNTSIATNEDV